MNDKSLHSNFLFFLTMLLILSSCDFPIKVIDRGATQTAETGDLQTAVPATLTAISPNVPYDDFKDPEFEGKYNRKLWAPVFNPGDTLVEQKRGRLVMSQQSAGNGGLQTTRRWTIDQVSMIEAKIELASNMEAAKGNVGFGIGWSADNGWAWIACKVGGEKDASQAWASCASSENHSIGVPVEFDTEQKISLQIDPDTADLTILVNDLFIDSFALANPESLKQAKSIVELSIFSEGDGFVSGYLDDVRIGK